MTPADVAENLMPKPGGQDAAEACLRNLIEEFEAAAAGEARRKAEEDQGKKSDGGEEEKGEEISGEVKWNGHAN